LPVEVRKSFGLNPNSELILRFNLKKNLIILEPEEIKGGGEYGGDGRKT